MCGIRPSSATTASVLAGHGSKRDEEAETGDGKGDPGRRPYFLDVHRDGLGLVGVHPSELVERVHRGSLGLVRIEELAQPLSPGVSKPLPALGHLLPARRQQLLAKSSSFRAKDLVAVRLCNEPGEEEERGLQASVLRLVTSSKESASKEHRAGLGFLRCHLEGLREQGLGPVRELVAPQPLCFFFLQSEPTREHGHASDTTEPIPGGKKRSVLVDSIRDNVMTSRYESSMADQLSGFQDKLYWRQSSPGKRWHCFKKAEGGGYVSLCDEVEIKRSGGQAITRPDPWARCPICDGLEVKRRGWEESGPTRPAP